MFLKAIRGFISVSRSRELSTLLEFFNLVQHENQWRNSQFYYLRQNPPGASMRIGCGLSRLHSWMSTANKSSERCFLVCQHATTHQCRARRLNRLTFLLCVFNSTRLTSMPAHLKRAVRFRNRSKGCRIFGSKRLFLLVRSRKTTWKLQSFHLRLWE